MTTDPKKSLASMSLSETAKSDVDQLLQTGLADFSLRELLGLLVSSAGAAERGVYLEKKPTDKPNGFYDRSLQLGTIPIDVRVPRTRTGEFRPASLPSRYRRGYSEEVQSLLLGLLGSSRSINAAKDALQKMGLSNSEQEGTCGDGNDRGTRTAQQPAFGSGHVGGLRRWEVRGIA
jgi:transposase-like protein